MNDKLKIIEFRESDLDALRELFLKVRQSTFVWADHSIFDLQDFDIQTKGEYILTALYDEKVIGFISVWMRDNFIHHLYIDEAFHKLGIGKRLLKAALEQTKFPVMLKCLERNTQAVAFYKKTGFTEKGHGDNENGPYILFELNQKIE
ncbi:GNAT family N-acetyltransferase [Flavobacterium sp. LC2016-23]|uniref:GNAT family N-acetyltransferase n=1 Tax=Flavobacterium sp. LC2016-23 TaxID=2666330 RepID=UPI0012B01319|nr:GNAT family N-acetyltransferase [Flavobacterium sp. LC2016-23]MRX41834.1 GNAT family N-acetyltransferase [Flavobacterium sp. LC2016-23]